MTDLLTRDEAAERLRVHVDTLRRWRREGKGPAYVKLPGDVRYPAADLDAWLEQQRVAPTAESSIFVYDDPTDR